MKRSVLALLLLLPCALHAQHEWVYSMQALNLYDGIGAAAGMYDRSAINLRARTQWLGVDGAPETAQLSYQTRLNQRLGFGIRINGESIGAFDRSAAVAHLTWRTALGKGELAFGLGGGLGYEMLRPERLTARDAGDPLFIGLENQMSPLVNASAMFRNERVLIGLETQHLLRNATPWGEITTTRQPEALLIAGSSHALNAKWDLRPLAAVRYSAQGIVLPELQLGLWYSKQLWFGAGYRHQTAAYGFCEYRLRNKYRIAYSYGAPIGLTPPRAAHHEVMLGLFWGKNDARRIESIRYFQ